VHSRLPASKAGYCHTKSDECGRNTKSNAMATQINLIIAKTKFIHLILLTRRLDVHDPDFMPFEPAIRRAGPLDYARNCIETFPASCNSSPTCLCGPKKGLP
jgi:hypothetical protein